MPTLLEINDENILAEKVGDIKDSVISANSRINTQLNNLVQLKTDNPSYATEIQAYIDAAKNIIQNMINGF